MSDVPVGPNGTGDEPAIDMLAAALRTDSGDLGALVAVLTETLGDSLPADTVEVDRERGFADRLAGRPGRPVSVTVLTPDLRLRLASGGDCGSPPLAEVQRVVRGVVISRQDLSVEDWTRLLARALADLVARNAAAQDALRRLLGG